MGPIVRIEKIREALERADHLGADSIDEACTSAAVALGIPVEMVQAVAYAPDTEGARS